MKICPQCRAQFEDDMNFCLQDGTPLASADQFFNPPENSGEKTLNLPPTPNLPPTIAPTQGFYPPITQPTNQPLSNQPTVELKSQVTVFPKIETSPAVLGSLTADLENSKSRSNLTVAAVAGILVLLGTAIGGVMWLSQGEKNADTALANTKNQNSAAPANRNSDSGFSNGSTSTSVDNQSEPGFRSDSNNPKLANTTKPAATKEIEDKPTPKPTVSEEKEPPPEKTLTATPKPVPKTISAGVVNGKATNLVKPSYPPAARAVRASGAVNVQVMIDESGNVISASAVSGHPLLRASAVSAARSSKFSPTILSGQAVKVTGVIVYNFVP